MKNILQRATVWRCPAGALAAGLGAGLATMLAGCAAGPAQAPAQVSAQVSGMAAPAVPPPPLALEARFGDLARTRGAAVALAGGLVLTAAHVVDEASLREELCRLGRWPAEPAPYLAGLRLRPPGGEAVPATRLRLGRSTFTRQGSNQATQLGCNLAYRAGQDLALLRPEHPLPGPGATICAENPTPGQLVTAFSAGRPVQGRLAGEVAEPEPANGQYAVLALRLQPGDSGGGVFDAASGCLIGIISMRDPAQPGHSWLVRAAVIRAFLAAEQSECPPDDGTRQCRLSPPDAFR